MGWFEDLFFGKKGGYETEGEYSGTELERMFAELGSAPEGELPDLSYLKALEEHVAWQDQMRRSQLGDYENLYQQQPFQQAGLQNIQNTLGNAPQDIGNYFAERGVSPSQSVTQGTSAYAGEKASTAQRKVMNRAQQLQLQTLEKMMGHVGDPSSGLSGRVQVGFDSAEIANQSLQQGWNNALMGFQQTYPAPTVSYDPGSPGLIPTIGGTLLGGVAGGLGGSIGGKIFGGLF